MKFSRIALLGTASLALAQHHNHARHHARHGSPVEGRDIVTVTSVDPTTVTLYELNGEFLDWAVVEAGLKSGIYVLMGDAISTVIPATTSTPTPTPSAVFYQEKSSTKTTPTSTYVAPTTTTAPPPAATTTEASSTYSSSPGSWPDFVSGKVKCSHFPSEYGPVAADWLDLGGFTGVQSVNSDFELAVSAAISFISTGLSGSGCTANSFCSYGCPAGYQKSQWPAAQGTTGQSIGGLYCGSDGYLHLSREEYPQLCTPGVGNVFVKNTLSSNVPICRTDYPGTESETIALNVLPGTTDALTCPDAKTYYVWENSYTSAQYYVNPAGTTVGDACVWGSPGGNVGNWAPVNIGVGKAITGETFISMFQNAPTNPDGKLNFNIEIDGGVSGRCTYKNGVFYSNGVVSSTGCTRGSNIEFYSHSIRSV
ncbi:glycoside hydrolase family 132 protein [Hyaloscypha bicolor E]|uniref:Glycoside hydrolase family 132 protein n=1 Tax=Hyaloscypha bicolor E TaxID=1095630 RepID=A0A2J6SM23_9HELO|nr:glycoside hydrolase family 132 protein [Hyaloscypha bicolor E]PMD51807.1 glycoside hydrolase family 132 protein [Hyaloscypha bicolor E]